MVHVFIEQGKEFKGDYDTVAPMMEVTCLGEKQYTTSKKDISQIAEVNWSEHVFLELRNIEKQEAEEA